MRICISPMDVVDPILLLAETRSGIRNCQDSIKNLMAECRRDQDGSRLSGSSIGGREGPGIEIETTMWEEIGSK